MERHDLLVLTGYGREYAWTSRKQPRQSDRTLWQKYAGVPAIFTGQAEGELLHIGFSLPLRNGPARYRIGSSVPIVGVERVLSVWDIPNHTSLSGNLGSVLDSLLDEGVRCGLNLGLFGAAALHMVTGLPYLHRASDLDLLVGLAPWGELEHFHAFLFETESCFGVRIDAELKIGTHQYIKFNELFQEQRTILVKGGLEPKLLSRQAIMEVIHRQG